LFKEILTKGKKKKDSITRNTYKGGKPFTNWRSPPRSKAKIDKEIELKSPRKPRRRKLLAVIIGAGTLRKKFGQRKVILFGVEGEVQQEGGRGWSRQGPGGHREKKKEETRPGRSPARLDKKLQQRDLKREGRRRAEYKRKIKCSNRVGARIRRGKIAAVRLGGASESSWA